MGMKGKYIRKLTFLLLILSLLLIPAGEQVWADQGHDLSGQTAGSPETIIFSADAPEAVMKAVEKALPGYEIKQVKGRSLAQFLAGADAVLAYDVQALPLIGSGADFYFYPLYTEAVVIAVDRGQTDADIKGWEDLSRASPGVNINSSEPQLHYIWAAISHAFSGKIDNDITTGYLAPIHKSGRLQRDDPHAPLQILLGSPGADQYKTDKDREIIIPAEGTLSFDIGILSRRPLPEEKILYIMKECQNSGYKLLDILQSDDNVWPADSGLIHPAASLLAEFVASGDITAPLRRDVLEVRRHVPADNSEHHLVSLFLLILITLWIARVKKQIIHPGIRRGLYLTGILLMGWISLSVLKYSFYPHPLAERYMWYFYYAFILSLPILSLYVAVNADNAEDSIVPPWLKLCGVIAAGFLILVLTNDLHQGVFVFHSDNPAEWGEEYTRGLGFTLLSIWSIISQFVAFALMLMKSWDSPRRKRAVWPALIFFSAIFYSIMYNLGVPFFHDIALTLGMSILVFLFWAAVTYSGLIPSNRYYQELFASSSLDMQIIDLNGDVRFRSAGASPLDADIIAGKSDRRKTVRPEKDTLIWSTPISGGSVITREDIKVLNETRDALRRVTQLLEDENLILAQKEQVRSRLILLEEQNRLAGEVNEVIKGKIQKMQDLLNNMDNNPETQRKTLNQIHRLALFCKRRSELLIQSKRHLVYPSQELCRLVQETSASAPENFVAFCQMDVDLSYQTAAILYEYFHIINDLACAAGIGSITVRIYPEGEDQCLYLLADGEIEPFMEALENEMFPGGNDVEITTKDLGDSFSVIIRVREGGKPHA